MQDRERLLWMHRKMVEIRTFETRASELFAAGKIPGFVHLYIGEEAVATGACANLRDDDFITSTHRGHGHCIAKGGKLEQMMAELFARETGYCKGKGGSMHIADLELGILGANGIVGGGLGIAPGAGLSAVLRGTDQVTACFFGDGASNQTTFHEGINLASAWKLPVVFINENNLYGISLRQDRHQNVTDIADRAAAYGIPGVVVDGNDVTAVDEAVAEAVKRARAGEGPSLIECKTYRWRGHFEGDPCVYRDDAEVEEWKGKDPIPRFESMLADMGILDEAGAKKVWEEVAAEVERAVKFAEESKEPAPEAALDLADLYA